MAPLDGSNIHHREKIMKDLIATNMYVRLISDMDWMGTSEEIPDFNEEPIRLHTTIETIDIVKHKITDAIKHQDNEEVLVQLYKDDERVHPAFSVQTFEDPNEIAVFLFDYVDDAEQTPMMRCLISKCNCCDDMNLSINPNDHTLTEVTVIAEFMERAHIIASAWGEMVKDAENRSIQ